MPNDFMALDQNLPRFTGEEDIERRVDALQDYQYQMLEALRYMMYHLDTRNLNMTEINRYMGTITDPINARIEDAEGNLTELTGATSGWTCSTGSWPPGSAADSARARRTWSG